MFPARSSGRRPTSWWPTSTRRPSATPCALAATLRQGAGGAPLAVEVYPDVDKLGKQFKYAADRGIPFVAVVGAEERQLGQVTIKSLGSGAQEAVARDRAAEYIVTNMRTSRG